MMKRIRGHTGKLDHQWDGPHRVVYATPDGPTVVIRYFDDPTAEYQKVSVHRLKKYTPRPDPVQPRVNTISPGWSGFPPWQYSRSSSRVGGRYGTRVFYSRKFGQSESGNAFGNHF